MSDRAETPRAGGMGRQLAGRWEDHSVQWLFLPVSANANILGFQICAMQKRGLPKAFLSSVFDEIQ